MQNSNREPFLKTQNAIYVDDSLDKKVDFVLDHLSSRVVYWSVKRSIKSELIKSKYKLKDISASVPTVLEEKGMKVKIQNEIFRIYKQFLSSDIQIRKTEEENKIVELPKNPEIDVVSYARVAWSDFLKEQLLSISKQLSAPFSKQLMKPEDLNKKKKKISKKKTPTGPTSPTSASSNPTPDIPNPTTEPAQPAAAPPQNPDLPKYTGVYGPSNMFEVCIKIKNPNHERTFSDRMVGWGLIKLELKTKTFDELKIIFDDLNPCYRQEGLDELLKEYFSKENLLLAKKVEESGFLPIVTKFARKGIPPSCRPDFWKKILNVESSAKEKGYYQKLLNSCKLRKLLTDDMIENDVKRTCDDENYFVFEDVLNEVMKAFSRDPWLHENCSLKSIPLMGINSKGEKKTVFPPNGIVPFEGLTLICSPLCYLFQNNIEVFYTFRNFYARHLCRLHVVSSQPDSLIYLCKFFEDLLQSREPQLFYHLLQLNIHPLSIAFHWIFHGFAGYLRVDQLLILWDRILGFGNLLLLPIFAASIFWLRSKFLLATTSQQEIYDVFSDFTVIKVVPLIQMFLFTSNDA